MNSLTLDGHSLNSEYRQLVAAMNAHDMTEVGQQFMDMVDGYWLKAKDVLGRGK